MLRQANLRHPHEHPSHHVINQSAHQLLDRGEPLAIYPQLTTHPWALVDPSCNRLLARIRVWQAGRS